MRSRRSRDAALLYLGIAAFGAGVPDPGAGALAPLGPPGLDLRFAAMRAAPPEGWRAAAVLVLVLLGAGSKAGLAPLHVWLPLAHPAAPSHVSALMSGAMTKVALYVMVRLLLDLCGPVQPLGGACRCWRWAPARRCSARCGPTGGGYQDDAGGQHRSRMSGFIAIGLGLALAARAADLPALAALALGRRRCCTR